MPSILEPLPLSNAGDKGVVVSGTVWDALVTRVNLLCNPSVNPPDNSAAFYVSKSGYVLDLSLLVQQVSNAAAHSYTGATVNCVGNVATVTFTP